MLVICSLDYVQPPFPLCLIRFNNVEKAIQETLSEGNCRSASCLAAAFKADYICLRPLFKGGSVLNYQEYWIWTQGLEDTLRKLCPKIFSILAKATEQERNRRFISGSISPAITVRVEEDSSRNPGTKSQLGLHIHRVGCEFSVRDHECYQDHGDVQRHKSLRHYLEHS